MSRHIFTMYEATAKRPETMATMYAKSDSGIPSKCIPVTPTGTDAEILAAVVMVLSGMARPIGVKKAALGGCCVF
jgi:hypothetical protein